MEKSNVNEYQDTKRVTLPYNKSLKSEIKEGLMNGIFGTDLAFRRNIASIKDNATNVVYKFKEVFGRPAFFPYTNNYTNNESTAGGNNKQRTKKRCKHIKHIKHRKTKRTMRK